MGSVLGSGNRVDHLVPSPGDLLAKTPDRSSQMTKMGGWIPEGVAIRFSPFRDLADKTPVRLDEGPEDIHRGGRSKGKETTIESRRQGTGGKEFSHKDPTTEEFVFDRPRRIGCLEETCAAHSRKDQNEATESRVGRLISTERLLKK